jgi:hypothetical protein
MFGALSRWLDGRRRRRAAIAAAVRQFEATTGAEAHPGISSVIGEEARGMVVRVCHGHDIKPPGRAWYVIGADGAVIAELSFAEAGRFGERLWR